MLTAEVMQRRQKSVKEESDILAFVQNVLDIIDQDGICNTYEYECVKYYLEYEKPDTTHIVVSLTSYAENHTGYCSDCDDQSIRSNEKDKTVYIVVPEHLVEQLPTLQESINEGYYRDKVLPRHSQCDCGGCTIESTVVDLEIEVIKNV